MTPIKNDKDEIIAAKLLVYAGEPEEYYTFITSEAYNALKDWIDFCALHGEDINDKSPVMRNIWRTADVKRRKLVMEREEEGRESNNNNNNNNNNNSTKRKREQQ